MKELSPPPPPNPKPINIASLNYIYLQDYSMEGVGKVLHLKTWLSPADMG